MVVGQAVDAFFAAAGSLAFRDGDEVADAPRPRLRGHRDGAVAPVPAAGRLAGLRRAAHRRAGVPGDARRLGALRRAAQPDHRALPGDGRRAAELRRRRSPARSCCATRDARRFMAADRAFLASLADQAAHALERARLYEERAYVARTLQAGLLPERLADVPGLEVAVRYHSIADGGAVGGDFYDCFDISPARWLVAVGDVAGKGTAAAVLTGLARHTLRAIALRDERPEDMLRFLNEALRRQSVTRPSAPSAARRSSSATAAGSTYAWPPAAIRTRCSCARAAGGGGRRARHAAGRRGRPDARAGPLDAGAGRHAGALHRRRDRRARRRPASGSARSGCSRRSRRRPAARPRRWRRAIDETVAAFDHDVQRDDRAIVVLRVSRWLIGSPRRGHRAEQRPEQQPVQPRAVHVAMLEPVEHRAVHEPQPAAHGGPQRRGRRRRGRCPARIRSAVSLRTRSTISRTSGTAPTLWISFE